MLQTYSMPDAGEGLTEADLVSWKVGVGDTVQVHDVIAEIETAKSLVELPAPWSGTVVELLVAEGDTVEVGVPIAVIDDGHGGEQAPTGDDTATPATGQAGDAAPADDDDPAGPNLIGYGPSASVSRRAGAAAAAAGGAVAEAASGAAVAARSAIQARSSISGRVLAKPPARRLAQRLGINLDEVTGTGRDGVITRVDVMSAQQARDAQDAAPAPAKAPAPRPAEEGTRLAGYAPAPEGPLRRFLGQATAAAQPFTRTRASGVRRATAHAVSESADRHVHVTEWTTVDITATMDLVARLKKHRDFRDLKVSPLLVHAKAVCLALRRHPDLNATWEDEPGDILHHGGVNLGIAAATPRGLLVPNIKSADQMGLLELCLALNELVDVARAGKLQPLDCQYGTFTITNVGVFGVDAGTPVINGDESAILCMGSIDRRPWVVGTGDDERIEPRWVTTLALTFDHKIIDGEGGSRFLRDVADILHDPANAMLY